MKNYKLAISTTLFLLLFSGNSYALSLNTKISEAEKNYKSKNYQKAYDNYQQAQIEEPDNELLKYNLGNSAYKVGKYDDAVKTFKSLSEKTKSQLLKEKALYNLGNTYYKTAKLEDAEKSYSDALKIDNNDQDAKKNLEKVREELKKRKKQEQDRKNNQKDQQKSKDNSDKKKDSKDQGKQDNKEDKNKNQKNNKQTKPDKKDNSSNKSKQQDKTDDKKDKKNGNPQQARPNKKTMSKEEAQRWLDVINDTSKEVMKKQILKRPIQGYSSRKDW
ncbi:MAG: tetratricopeptide repeat protein [Candidatus Sericytochromatia bacterium]|nr:tetratricopeptide repeat protein [Candidatus Sericytochromatia bacterium]